MIESKSNTVSPSLEKGGFEMNPLIGAALISGGIGAIGGALERNWKSDQAEEERIRREKEFVKLLFKEQWKCRQIQFNKVDKASLTLIQIC